MLVTLLMIISAVISASGFVAGANPSRTHVGVTTAIGPQQSKRCGIGSYGRKANRTHGERTGKGTVYGVPNNCPDHPQSEQSHRRTFG